MTQFYSITDPIKYEGPGGKSELAFRWYNPGQKVLGKTMAEIPLAEKNRISHRAVAFRALAAALRERGVG